MPPKSPISGTSKTNGPRAAVALLLLINLLNYIDRYVLSAVEPLIAKDLLEPNDPRELTKMGALAMAFMVSYMISAPLFGWLGDRWRRWAIIGIGVLLFTLASGASGHSVQTAAWFTLIGAGTLSGYAVMLVTRMFVGIGEGAYGPLAPTLLADLFPVQRRGAILAWFYMAIPVGSAMGYVLGGLVSHQFGWPMAFYVLVPPGIILGILCFFMKEPVRGAVDAATITKRPLRLADYLVLLKTPSYVFTVLGMTAATFAIGGVSFWMPRYIAEFRHAMPIKDASFMFGAITAVTGIVATLVGGWLADRLRSRVRGAYLVVSGGSMLLGFPLFLAVIYVPFPYAWGVIVAAIFCLFLCTGPSNAAVANVSHPSMRAIAFAMCIFTIHALGDAISPWIIGVVSDLSGGNMNAGFLVVSGMIAVSGVLWLVGSRWLDEDTLRAPHRFRPD